MDNYRHNIRHELEELIGTDFTENTVLNYYCPLNLTRLSQHAENGVLGDFLVATSPYC